MPSTQLVVMYHSESSQSVKNAVSSCLSDSNGQELCVEYLLHLPWYGDTLPGKLYIGEYHEHMNNTSRNVNVLAGITYK